VAGELWVMPPFASPCFFMCPPSARIHVFHLVVTSIVSACMCYCCSG
jgi:hypothetical protein